MGSHRMALIKPPSAGICKPGTRGAFLALAVLLLAAPAAAQGMFETWASESFSLQPRESFQIKVTYDQIQVRNVRGFFKKSLRYFWR